MRPGSAKGEKGEKKICEGRKLLAREEKKVSEQSEKSGSLGRGKGPSLGSLPSPIFAVSSPPFFAFLILSSHYGAWNGQVPGQK